MKGVAGVSGAVIMSDGDCSTATPEQRNEMKLGSAARQLGVSTVASMERSALAVSRGMGAGLGTSAEATTKCPASSWLIGSSGESGDGKFALFALIL